MMTLESPRSAPLLLALIVSDLDPINGKAWGSCQIKSFSMFKVYCINFGRILPCHYFQPSEICLPSHAASVGKMMLNRSILRPSSYLHRELNVSDKTLLDQVQLEECKEMKDEEILQMIIQRYNNYKANSALKKWQISPDQQSAISGIIWGMCPTARLLVKQHLDFNKYDESGYWDSWVYLFEKH